MRIFLKTGAVLDLISMFFMAPQVWLIINHFDTIPPEPFSIIRVSCTLLIFLSLFVSALGQFLLKKYGLITYYVQFPFRLVLWVFSIGFITLLPELIHKEGQWFGILFRICIIAEFFRLYYTVMAHKAFFRKVRQ